MRCSAAPLRCLLLILLSHSYSVFTVTSVHVPPQPDATAPIVIHIQAAACNDDERQDLPLAPWH